MALHKPSRKKKEYLYHACHHKEFKGLGTKTRIEPGSEAHKVLMLPEEELPENYGFMVKNHKFTKEGKWMRAACLLEMTLNEFAIVAYMLPKDRMIRQSGRYHIGKPRFERSLIRAVFSSPLRYESVVNILVKLKRRGLIENNISYSVSLIESEAEKIFEKYEYEIVTFEEYIMKETEGASGSV